MREKIWPISPVNRELVLEYIWSHKIFHLGHRKDGHLNTGMENTVSDRIFCNLQPAPFSFISHKGFFWPPFPANPKILYSRGKFVDMVYWTVGIDLC